MSGGKGETTEPALVFQQQVLQKVVPQKLVLEVGQTFALVPKRNRVHSLHTKDKDSKIGLEKKYKWTLYVKVKEGLVSDVHEVTFQLHPTFNPPKYIKFCPTKEGVFCTTQTSWGLYFEASILVKFKDNKKKIYKHMLKPEEYHRDYEYCPKPMKIERSVRPAPVPKRTFSVELALVKAHVECVEAFSLKLAQSFPDWRVEPRNNNEGEEKSFKFLLASPSLFGSEGVDKMNQAFVKLSTLGIETCSDPIYNVSIDISSSSIEGYRKLLCQYAKFETAVFHKIMPSSTSHIVDILNQKRNCKMSNKELNQYIGELDMDVIKELPLFRVDKRIEFRQYAASNYGNFKRNWVRLLLHFVENSLRFKAPDNFKSQTEDDVKFDRFFDWVIKDNFLREFFAPYRADEFVN